MKKEVSSCGILAEEENYNCQWNNKRSWTNCWFIIRQLKSRLKTIAKAPLNGLQVVSILYVGKQREKDVWVMNYSKIFKYIKIKWATHVKITHFFPCSKKLSFITLEMSRNVSSNSSLLNSVGQFSFKNELCIMMFDRAFSIKHMSSTRCYLIFLAPT